MVIAAQDKVLQTKNHAETETSNQCRLSQQFDETVEQIISACPILATEQYIKRHDRVCAHLH